MKRFLLFWTIIAIILVAPAQERATNNNTNDLSQRETHVTPAEALNVGYTFMRTGVGTRGSGTRSSDVRKQDMQLIYTGRAVDSTTRATTDCYYVFALQPKGFVIVAADNRVEPILGYSYDNDFVVENMPAHVRGWLGHYEEEIEAVVKQNITPESETTTKWSRLRAGQSMSTRSGESVGPLLTTQWGQGWPYNAMCPENNWGHALVGCVATAYAQVLNYWRYPPKGNGFHSYQHNDYGYIYADLEHTEYHWDNMPDVVTDYNEDVAVLNFHAGAVLDMDYGPFSSGTYISGIPYASKKYFGYSPNIGLAGFDGEVDIWDNVLRTQLYYMQPLIISAYNNNYSTGHSYVIDGVDDEFFHINFGWNGFSDGFYLIRPNTDLTQYQYGMSAVINMRPNKKICLFKATKINTTGATLHASLNAEGDSFDSIRFVVWLDSQLPHDIFPSEINFISGSNVVMTKAMATGLRPNSIYKYCLLISNQNQIFSSDTLEFQTAESTDITSFTPIVYDDTIYVCDGNTWQGRAEGHYHDTTYFVNSNTINYVINTTVIGSSIMPNVHVTASQTEICQNDSVLLVAQGASHFVWDHNLINHDSVLVCPESTTTFHLVGEIDGCLGVDSITVSVRPSFITSTQFTIDSGLYWMSENNIVTQSLVIDDTLQTIQGCDSIVRTILFVPHFAGGKGTADEPYQIASRADMEELSNAMTSENDWSLNKYFIVTNDIYEPVNTVVGHNTHPFMGHFDGNNKTIMLNVDVPDSSDVGLIAFMDSNAIVKNVIVDGSVKGKSNVGAVCGYNFGGLIVYCTNKARVTGVEGNTGGICGNSFGGVDPTNGLPAGKVEHCINIGEIHGTGLSVGGVTGNGDISYCINIGTIYNGAAWTGGVLGSGTTSNSINAGIVLGGNWQTGTVTGYGSSTRCVNVGYCGVNYPTSKVIGKISGDGNSNYCFDDRQISATTIDNNSMNNTQFLQTINLLGDAQSESLDTLFTYSSGLYPIPSGFNQDSIALLAATPVLFAATDTRLSIKAPFHVSNANGVVWSSKAGRVMIENGNATPTSLGNDTLIAQLGNNRKMIPINVDCVPTDDTLFLFGCREVTFNNSTFIRDTVFNSLAAAQDGSDSLFTVLIDVQWQLVDVYDSLPADGVYSFNGRQLYRHGIYYDTLTNVIGCDSVVRLNLRGPLFSGGDGSKENPYLITCREDMYELADSVMVGEDDWSADKHFRLMNDIVDTLYREIPRFSGFFYGGGHSIFIHLDAHGEDIGTYGLFVSNGRIIDSLNVYGYMHVQSKCTRMGAVVGSNDGTARVSNCNNYANVVGLHSAGICGWNANGALVISCNNYGNITGKQSAGGICAENLGGIVEYCQNAGRIEAYSAGGIVAYDGTVMYCINIGEVFNMEGCEGNVGGISSGGTVIKGCLNAGNVHKMNGRYDAGGIIGSTSNTLSNCINLGQISSIYPNSGRMDPLYASNTNNYPNNNSFYDRQRYPKSLYGDIRGKNTFSLLGSQTPMYGDASDCNTSVYERNAVISEYYIDYNTFAAWINCGWTVRDGLYPCPTVSDKAYTDIAFVATSPILFSEGNTVDSITKPFYVSTQYGVRWSSTVGNVLVDNVSGVVRLVGVGSDTLVASLGNASMRVPLTIKSIPHTDTIILIQGCDLAEYNNQIYTSNSFIQECYTNLNNQDSVINVVIQINKTIEETVAYINPGEYYIFRSDTMWQSGVYYDTLVSAMGCDSIFKLNLIVLGDIVYVRPDGNGNGTSWENALSDINIASSVACHFGQKKQVWVSKGLYQPKDTIANSAFWVNGGVTILGGFVGNEPPTYDVEQRDIYTNRSVLSGRNKMTVVTLDDWVMSDEWPNNHFPVTIDGFYITEGNSSNNGGGAKFYGDMGTVSRCVIYGNSAQGNGGGVYGNGLIVGSVIDGNTATVGGGVCGAKIENSLIVNNAALYAGGVNSSVLTNSIVWHNQPDQCQNSLVDYSCVENGHYGNNNIDIAHENDGDDLSTNYVRFLDPENGIYLLSQNSICVNAGSEDLSSLHLPNYDMALHDRIINNLIDIGPFEQKCVSSRVSRDTVVLGANAYYSFYDQEISSSGKYYYFHRHDDGCDTLDMLDLLILPSCYCPSHIYVDSIGTNHAVVYWEGNSSSYSIEYGQQGFSQGEGQVVQISNPSLLLGGLNQNTSYDVYVTSLCDSMEVSESVRITFSTLPSCPKPINLFCSADSTVATIRWQESDEAVLWEYEYGPSGFAPGTGTLVQTSNTNNTLTGLLPFTSYDVYVYAVCGEDDRSEYVKGSFHTKKRLYVTPTGGGLQNGVSWDNAYSDLQIAIFDASLTGADVWVAAGTYNSEYTEDYAFSIPDNVAVFGGFVGDEPYDFDINLRNYKDNASILDGNNSKPVVYCGGVLDGFTIQNGFADNYAIGAAFTSSSYDFYGGLGGTIINCIVKDNVSTFEFFGGIVGGTAINCLVYDNTNGGACWSHLINCTLYEQEVYAGQSMNSVLWGNVTDCISKFSALPGATGRTSYYMQEIGNVDISDNNYQNLSVFNLVDPENGDFRLSYGSACINAGSTDISSLILPSVDLQGLPRVLDGRVDMGAYEYYPVPVVEMYDTICEGGSIVFFDSVYNTEGRYIRHLSGDITNDTLQVLYLTVFVPDYEELFETVCDSFSWNGEIFTESDTYVRTLTNKNGCDSVITLHLIVLNSTHNVENVTACESYEWHGVTYVISGTYINEYINNEGCPSADTLYLTINNTYHEDLHISACEEYVWNGETYTESGEYLQTFTAVNGCDSIVTLHLTINHGTHNTATETACDAYEWNNETYTESGTYTYEYTNEEGCPSVDTLYLTINYSTTSIDEQTACESYTWIDGVIYTESTNTPTYTLTNAAGCDSVVTLHLTINSAYYEYLHVSACEEYEWNGVTYAESGDFEQAFTAANGCDSVVTLYLTINNPLHTAVTETVCESFTWNGTTYTMSGDYTFSHLDANNCTQVDTLHLIILHGTHNTAIVTECDAYEWNNETYAESGTYTYEYTNEAGCPSVDTLYLTVNYSTTAIDEQTACESFTWIDGITYTESTNEPTYTLTNMAGCDSVVSLHLTINNPQNESVSEIAYDFYEWNGGTYYTTGVYTYEHQDANGCMQIDTLHLTVYYSSSSDIYQIACESFTWNGETFTTSGEYERHFSDIHGADSVVTLHLTVNHGTHNAATETACDAYEWNNETYTESGTYTYEYTNEEGCTSVDTLYLTVNYSTTGIDEQTACESFTWIDGVTYTESTNEPTYTLTNAAGCDSVVTLHLTVTNTDHTDFTDELCGSYTWNGETYTESGTYTQTFTNSVGCDSIVTLYLTINSPTTGDTTATACEDFTWHGITYTSSGSYQTYLTNAAGCDSVVTLHLLINENESTEFTIVTGDSCYLWNGISYCMSGDYIQTLQTINGCDSVVTFHLTITVGVEDHELTSMMVVYPNPTNHIANVVIIDQEMPVTDLVLYDTYGRLLQTIPVVGVTTQIDLSRYAKGTYFVKAMINGRIVAVKKVMKQ